MRIVLLGAPGVGKGTQAKLVSELYSVPHISTGDLFRANISEKTPLGISAKEYIETGNLVPDSLTISIVKDRLSKKDCSNGFLLDGFPRNLFQAQALEAFLAEDGQQLDKVILIDVPENIILERIEGRRFCDKCGSSYHIKFNPSKLEGKCQVCGGTLKQRKDDTGDIIHDRLSVYKKITAPLIQHYTQLGILSKVIGNCDINDVFQSINSSLKAIDLRSLSLEYQRKVM